MFWKAPESAHIQADSPKGRFIPGEKALEKAWLPKGFFAQDASQWGFFASKLFATAIFRLRNLPPQGQRRSWEFASRAAGAAGAPFASFPDVASFPVAGSFSRVAISGLFLKNTSLMATAAARARPAAVVALPGQKSPAAAKKRMARSISPMRPKSQPWKQEQRQKMARAKEYRVIW